MMNYSRRQALMMAVAPCALTLSGAFAALAGDSVGVVEKVANDAWGTPAGAARSALSEAAMIFRNEKLETGDDSATAVRFVDASRLSLGANSHLVIDEYVFAGAASRSTYTLARGALRFISGTMPEKNMRLKTPTVAIGIRGTELKIDVYDDGSTELSTIEGAASVASILTNEVLEVLAGQSVLSDAKGIFIGGVRDFIHKSADNAIERGLSELRSRSPIPLPDIPIPNPFR